MGGNLKNTNCHCFRAAYWLKTFSFWGYPPLNSSKRWRFHPGSTNCAWEPFHRATATNLLADCIYLRKMVCPFENQPAELIFLVDVRRAGLGSPAGLVLTFSRNCILEQVKARRTGSALLPCWHPKCNNGKLLSSNINLRQVFDVPT